MKQISMKKHLEEVKKAVSLERYRIIKLITKTVFDYHQKANVILLYLDRKYYGMELLENKLKYAIKMENES